MFYSSTRYKAGTAILFMCSYLIRLPTNSSKSHLGPGKRSKESQIDGICCHDLSLSTLHIFFLEKISLDEVKNLCWYLNIEPESLPISAISSSAPCCSLRAPRSLSSLSISVSDSCHWGHSQDKRSAVMCLSKFTSHRVRFWCSSVTCTKHQSKSKPVINDRSCKVVWSQCISRKSMSYLVQFANWPNDRYICFYHFFSHIHSHYKHIFSYRGSVLLPVLI